MISGTRRVLAQGSSDCVRLGVGARRDPGSHLFVSDTGMVPSGANPRHCQEVGVIGDQVLRQMSGLAFDRAREESFCRPVSGALPGRPLSVGSAGFQSRQALPMTFQFARP